VTPFNLDLDTLRTLVTAHEMGGFAQAADRLSRTPSAISLQMKRLQEDVGTALFRKRGLGLALTEAGETTLQYARTMLALNDELLHKLRGASFEGDLRFGCPQDFASLLPTILQQFAAVFPHVRIDLRVEGNGALVEALEKNELDLAVTIGFADRTNAEHIADAPLLWIASPEYTQRVDEPLLLATLGPQCGFRKRALQALDEAAAPYRIAASSPSLDGLWAAVLGGLGVTARTALHLPHGLVTGKTLHGLPALGTLPVALHRHTGATGPAVELMQSLLRSALVLNISRLVKPLALVRKA
jgi:DNA-binding transcriptional LysR family regulator